MKELRGNAPRETPQNSDCYIFPFMVWIILHGDIILYPCIHILSFYINLCECTTIFRYNKLYPYAISIIMYAISNTMI